MRRRTRQQIDGASELGDWLRRLREEKGLSLSAASVRTVIPASYLAAIEAGRLNIFPDDLYMVGYLRRYGAFLGVDLGRCVTLFGSYGERARIHREWYPDPGSSCGSSLQRLRLERGVTLDDIEKVTRIRSHYLDALETNRFHLLPGGLFRRAYIRQVATFLKADAEALLRLIEMAAGPRTPDLIHQPISSGVGAVAVGVAASTSRAAQLGLRMANRVFSMLEALAPRRITNEELGDALEAMSQPGRSAIWIWTKLITSVIWFALHAFGHVRSSVSGKGA